MQRAMGEVGRDRTMVIIAHRFSTLRLAQRVIVIEEGRVRGVGSHEELLRDNQVYRRLYQRQWADVQSPSGAQRARDD